MGNPTVGEVPDHWEFTTLGEVCDRGGGNIQTGPFGSQLHASDYVEEGIPSIMPVNIGDNRLIEADIKRITEEDAERLDKHRVVPGDIIYSRRGDVERRALVREKERGWLCGTGCIKVRLGEGVVDPAFASFYLDHPNVRQWIVQHAVGATMPNLNTGIMKSIPFVLPPPEEQRAIASILGALDDKIELNRRMNATLESLARAIFKSWFVDFDPVKINAGQMPASSQALATHDPKVLDLFPSTFQDSELGPIPEGWSLKPLYETAQYVNGAAFKSKDFCEADDGLPVVKIAELKSGISGQTKFSQKEIKETQRIETGDLLYSWSGSPETSLATFVWAGGKGLLNQHIFNVITESDAQKHFVYYLLKHLRDTLVGIARDKQTTGLGHVTVADMKRLQVCIPPDGLMSECDATLGKFYDACFANDLESRNLATARDTLLPQLLSGELPVPAALTRAEEALA